VQSRVPSETSKPHKLFGSVSRLGRHHPGSTKLPAAPKQPPCLPQRRRPPLVNSAPVEQQLGVGADGYGILVAASGVGGMAAGVSCARLARRRRVAAVTTVSCALSTVGLLLYAGTSLLAVALAIAVLTGMGIVVADVVIDVAITRAARGDVLGRIFGALEGVQVAGIVLGAVTAPALTSILGVRLALVLFGTATTV
jgi:MFS family permease